MPGGIPEAGLVAKGPAAGQERGSWRPLEGAPQREGAGVVSAAGRNAQDRRRAADFGGGADVACLVRSTIRHRSALLE